MKREEAIKAIEDNRPRSGYIILNEALDMAITALQNQPVWSPVSKRLPEELVPVNVTWINRNPESYYAKIKDVPFSATAVYYNSKWYWYSSTCVDYLSEYGKNDFDLVDKDIDIIEWQTIQQPYKQNKAYQIRSMTDEELAAFNINFDNRFGEEYEGEQSCLAWLQKESEEQ